MSVRKVLTEHLRSAPTLAQCAELQRRALHASSCQQVLTITHCFLLILMAQQRSE